MSVTLAQWKDFKSTNIHKEIQKEFHSWLSDIRMELEDPRGDYTDKELHRLGGNAETVRRSIGVIDIIINRIEMEKEANNG